MSAPLFSVVIPAYNRAALLSEALDSVFAQTHTDYEVIVVDDGSTDGTREWLASHGTRLRVFMQSNRGPGAARNLGVQNAQGEYLAFLDSDDLWFPWTLEVYAQAIKRTNEPSFIAGKPKQFSELRELEPVKEEPLAVKAFADYYASGDEWRWWGVSSFVIRAEALRSVGGFTNLWINGEDADLALRLGEAKGFVQVSAPSTFGYRDHAGSAMKSLPKTLEGAWYKVRAEVAGQYPGGPDRARERWRILTRHLRPITLDCLRHGMRKEAWELYRATFRWHAQLGRFKFLAAFPALAFLALCRRNSGPPPSKGSCT